MIHLKKQGEIKIKRPMTPKQRAGLELGMWKKGQSGNSKGPPRSRCYIYNYICKFMAMTPEQLTVLDKSRFNMSQRAALKTVMEMGKGEWQRIREIIERDGKQEDREEGIADQKIELVIKYID